MLLGHRIGLEGHYYRPTIEKTSQEYMKAVNNLTIHEENRLKIKVAKLEKEKTNFEILDTKIDAMQRQWLSSHVTVGGAGKEGGGNGRPITDEEIEHILKRRRISDRIRRDRDRKLFMELK